VRGEVELGLRYDRRKTVKFGVRRGQIDMNSGFRSVRNIRPVFVALHVKDIESSARFYRDIIGIPLHKNENPAHYEYSWHGTYFHFALFQVVEGEKPSRSDIGFSIDHLDGLHAKMISKGVTVINAPKEESWGFSAVYADPDGNTVSFTQLLPEHR